MRILYLFVCFVYAFSTPNLFATDDGSAIPLESLIDETKPYGLNLENVYVRADLLSRAKKKDVSLYIKRMIELSIKLESLSEEDPSTRLKNEIDRLRMEINRKGDELRTKTAETEAKKRTLFGKLRKPFHKSTSSLEIERLIAEIEELRGKLEGTEYEVRHLKPATDIGKRLRVITAEIEELRVEIVRILSDFGLKEEHLENLPRSQEELLSELGITQ
ncbi:MAG: hypothetical protein ABFQ95_06345 [Pseudomonadota bacterium]